MLPMGAPDIEHLFHAAQHHLDILKQPSTAASLFTQILEHLPDHLEARYNLGKALFALGDTAAAIASFRRAHQLAISAARPDAARLSLKSIAVAIPGDPSADNADILAARSAYAATLDHPAPISDFSSRDRSPDRSLTIAYLSSFFDRENWMKPVWALINQHPRDQFAVRLFSFGPTPDPDNPAATAWRPHDSDRIFDASGITNEALAKVILDEQIDILIDLNGYSDTDRLPLFMLRPAPVIVGWFNMYATTGLSCFDYLIGDAHVVHPDEERHYTERIARVPTSYLSFDVAYKVPDITPPPCLSNHHLTFGSLCSRYKITPDVIRAWSRILHRVPTSRLLLRNAALDTERDHLLQQFQQHDIPASRIILLGRAPHFEFLETYSQIDIALDTFPYNGGTTTTEALWQGVPVLTFPGPTWASRTSTTLLREGNLSDWVAPDLNGYIDTAARWASDPHAPRQLLDRRTSMRTHLRRSPVCNTPSFARSIECLYRTFWRSWCSERP